MKSFGLLAVLFVSSGCGRSAEERQLDAMREEIDSVREGRDRADHGLPPGHVAAEPGFVVPPAYTAGGGSRRPSAVVQLGAGGQGASDDGVELATEAADPQDTTPRPTIRVFGGGRGSGRSAVRGEDQIEQSGLVESAAGQAPSGRDPAPAHGGTVLDPEAARAYDAAMALVNARRYDEALDAFARFLVKWPDHPYANNAMYWRGECYFARGDYAHAAEQFEGVLARFPAGSKVPDALLKLGTCQQKLGNPVKAKECFDRLAQQFPDSDAARRLPAARAAASEERR